MMSSPTLRLHGFHAAGWITGILLLVLSSTAYPQSGVESTEPATRAAQSAKQSQLVLTHSPRQTLQSWLNGTRDLEMGYERYRQQQTHANYLPLSSKTRSLLNLLDLSEVPAALRYEAGIEATYALIDILARVELPSMSDVPDWDPYDESSPDTWRLVGTAITIQKMSDGPRAGEFLFNARAVSAAPDNYQRIRHLPLLHPSPVESWTELAPQVTGPMIPAAFVDALPEILKRNKFDTPVWKIFFTIVAMGFAAALFAFMHHRIGRYSSESRVAMLTRRMLIPLAVIGLAWLFWVFVQTEVNVAGSFAKIVDSTLRIIRHIAFSWLIWLVMLVIAEWVILSPRIPDKSLNASLLRLAARVLGIVAIVLILAYSAQGLGVPVLGVMAGLGFGGLAVALAVRPTLENLMGGVILFLDQPVRVGDYCSFGEHIGTVESIGIRSTKIRALDRTLITVPNAIFADMELINWARCDKMLILATVGLRYETEPDQLRLVLAQLREMLYAHPKIDRSTVRVRLTDFASSSLDVEVRVYALTRELNELHAIREDVFLRVIEIVSESGTGFAFPSQTLYLGEDSGLDQRLSEAAKEQVAGWRRSGILPFPESAASKIDDLTGTLDYPPRGSVAEVRPESVERQQSESLSQETSTTEEDDDSSIQKDSGLKT